MAAAAASAQAAGVLGKKELAALLKWSRPRLDRRLREDPRFPVLNQGTQAGGWSFDAAAVLAYLNGAGAPAQVEPDESEDLEDGAEGEARGEVVAFPRGVLGNEASARSRKDNADAALKEDRLRRARRDLVEVADVRDVLETLFVELRRELDAMPDIVGKECGLPDRVTDAMRVSVEQLMRSAGLRLKQRFAAMAPGAAPDGV